MKTIEYILAFIAALIIYSLTSLIFLSCRKEKVISREVEDLEASNRPFIYACWHGRMFPFAFMKPKHREIYAIVSRHGDGQLITDIMRFVGMRAIRGSTNRKKGEAKIIASKDRGGTFVIRESIRTLKKGHSIAVTPDGPKGPKFMLKRNFLNIAAITGVPIVPISFSASSVFVIPSWDRFILPKPFSKIKMIYGEMKFIPRLDTEGELEKYGQELQDEMNNITAGLDKEFGVKLN